MTEPGPPDRSALIAKATACHRDGRFSEAEAVYKSLLDLSPTDAGALHNLGVLLAETDRPDNAVEYFDRALLSDPGYASAHFNRAGALRALGDRAGAIAAYGQTVALDPANYGAHLALGFLWMSDGRRDRALDHFARTLELRRGDDRSDLAFASLTHTTRAKLRHDADQLRHIARDHWDAARFGALARTFDGIAAEIANDTPDDGIVALTASQLALVGDNYNTLYQFTDAPEVLSGAVNPALDTESIAARYAASSAGVVWFDDFLSPKALTLLRRFLLKSTIWYDFSHIGGCLAAYLEDGLACPLILQIADEVRTAFPTILSAQPLTQIWAFKAIDARRGIDVHVDDGAVSVNFWVTPDDANEDPEHGGLVIYDKRPPADWEMRDYASDVTAIRDFLGSGDQGETVIPYGQNRAVMFDSRLFHGSDSVVFSPNYEDHRINITMLFGAKSGKSAGHL